MDFQGSNRQGVDGPQINGVRLDRDFDTKERLSFSLRSASRVCIGGLYRNAIDEMSEGFNSESSNISPPFPTF